MNIHPSIWGRDVWNSFYFIALSYPKNPTPNDKLKYKQFYEVAGSIVPCMKCRKNFGQHLRELPIDNYLNSSYELFTWVNKMDNKVKKITNSKQFTVEETMNYYMNKIQKDANVVELAGLNTKEKILIFMGIIIIGLLLGKKLKYI